MNEAQFWNNVIKTAGCWYWSGGINNSGYGSLRLDGKRYMAHRLSYELTKGKIPEGLEIDHTCHNRICVNPDHLELATHQENCHLGSWATRTHCPRGHPYSGSNLYIDPRGKRQCRTCREQSRFEWRQRHGI